MGQKSTKLKNLPASTNGNCEGVVVLQDLFNRKTEENTKNLFQWEEERDSHKKEVEELNKQIAKKNKRIQSLNLQVPDNEELSDKLEELTKAELKLWYLIAGFNSSPQFMLLTYIVRTLFILAAIFTIINTESLMLNGMENMNRKNGMYVFLLFCDMLSSLLASLGACCRKAGGDCAGSMGYICQPIFSIASLVLTLINWLYLVYYLMQLEFSEQEGCGIRRADWSKEQKNPPSEPNDEEMKIICHSDTRTGLFLLASPLFLILIWYIISRIAIATDHTCKKCKKDDPDSD